MRQFLSAACAVAVLAVTSCSVYRPAAVPAVPTPAVPTQAELPAVTGDAFTDYISRYSPMAVSQMEKYGIPASITLAQGLLESDAGRSSLAVRCNNHFGIKCHSDWTGRTMTKDDDSKDECFRCYDSAEESYRDHSLFLVNGSRYSSLFKLGRTDYKGWARGLKAAGYATSPTYADKLIGLIERYGLDCYDIQLSSRPAPAAVQRSAGVKNECRYVVLAPGETLGDIAAEYGIQKGRLRRYNETGRSFTPPAGSSIFLEKKKTRSEKDSRTHTVKPGDSLWSISQQYGVRMKCITRRNAIGPDNPLTTGQVLMLR